MAIRVMEKDIESSSWDRMYGFFFYGLVRGLKPDRCVELGTYAGFSAYWISLALKHNAFGQLDCYDLWGKYPYNHVEMEVAQKNLEGLPVNLHQEDASLVYAHYKPLMVDLLMVDLSNDGFTYRKILDDWYSKLSPGAIVLMEGGTEERDKVSWMIEYKKEPIKKVLKDDLITERYNFITLTPFPGLTIFTKR